MDIAEIKQAIVERLQDVYDPEIPVNVYDLGLIYNIVIDENNNVHITMTLTSPTCPVADYVIEMVREAAQDAPGVNDVEVELTFEPRWTPEMVSREAKEELGLTDEVDTTPKGVELTFQPVDNKKYCSFCSNDDTKMPLIETYHKGENKLVCVKCIKEF